MSEGWGLGLWRPSLKQALYQGGLEGIHMGETWGL
jgi:hypothetical protein